LTNLLSHPLLLLAKQGNTSYPDDPQWNVYDFKENKSIRLVVRTIDPLSHPMHLHGHNFWVVAQGTGKWDGTVTRHENPQRRDTQLLDVGNPYDPAGGASYIVLEFVADNPGVWPFQCHVAWHVSDGLYINIMVRYSKSISRVVTS
jgi:FtsP/CotA-like multicopper oxidase with cupredoxin domain